jgi:hypothetical protein
MLLPSRVVYVGSSLGDAHFKNETLPILFILILTYILAKCKIFLDFTLALVYNYDGNLRTVADLAKGATSPLCHTEYEGRSL